MDNQSLQDERWWLGVSPAAKQHLLHSVESLEEESPTTPSFKLYGRDDWGLVEEFLSSAFSLCTVPEWQQDYELSRSEKFGPQGGHAPWAELRDNAEMYFSRPVEVKDTSCDVTSYASLSLQMLGVKECLRQLKSEGKVMTRAAGWRAFNLKKTDPKAQEMALRDLRNGAWRDGWAYFFSRYNKKKKRLFIPMPFSNMIGQARWFNPFLLAIQDDLRSNLVNSRFAFWGDKIGFKRLFTEVVSPRFQGVDPQHVVYVMRDFEKMDTTTGPSQKRAYFIPKLAAAFNYHEGSESFSDMCDNVLFSNHCPIATPEGMWTGVHGEASGATVTNGGETCCNEEYNRILQSKLRELVTLAAIRYKPLGDYGNGDDGISFYELEDLNRFDEFAELIRQAADFAADATGFRIQSDKWDIHLGSYGKYCQYMISWSGDSLFAAYPAALILNAIINPEKEYRPDEWDRDYRDLDIIMKLSNGVGLQYFTHLIDFVDRGMKYGLLGGQSSDAYRILSKYDKFRSLQDGSFRFNRWDDEEKGILFNPVVQYLLETKFSK